MIRVPLLTQHGVDALLETCNAEKPATPWDEPTCDSIYEHATTLGVLAADSLR